MRQWIYFCALAGLLSCSDAGRAQGVCDDRADIVATLEHAYGERKVAVALSVSGGLVELYTAVDGSWTLLYTVPDGPTCLLAAGEAWESWVPAPVTPETKFH
ncbi:MAG: hypothetical protein OEU46_22875 [Alphaproteobacteria bacterium]|nr:hypothetical protein [Alphaproteobacteria bacterium]